VSWSKADLPDLGGKRILVTGVTSGLGTDVALELAAKGAEVILAARSEEKLAAVTADLHSRVRDAQFQQLVVDLADLASVRRAAARAARFGPIDVLVNNAGVMATPYQRTADGYELQFATNHLGPFALTGLLLPQLVASGDGRVVNTASQAHRFARKAPLQDPTVLNGRYSKWMSYAQSKLADLLFTFELDRRLQEADLPVKALAAHPGYSATGLMHSGHAVGKDKVGKPIELLVGVFNLLGQPADMGALSTLMAATADLPGSTYIGPDGPAEMRGMPRIVTTTKVARDRDAQLRLWELSEEATGVRYP
jgi:NAD(P)-dependent dehydrogenase (short-subunit alcohol dehydrogenase family)